MKTKVKIHGKDVYQYIYGLIDSNMYVLIGDSSALLIDAFSSEDAVELLEKKYIQKLYIILTHEHYDHIQGINFYRKLFDCVVMGSEYALEAIQDPRKNLAAYIESLTLSRVLDEHWRDTYQIPEDYACKGDVAFQTRDEFTWEGIRFEICSTPGHSKGSICISVDNQFYFTGDSLVEGADIILRLPGGSKLSYLEVTKPYLKQIPKDSYIFPGHGSVNLISFFHII